MNFTYCCGIQCINRKHSIYKRRRRVDVIATYVNIPMCYSFVRTVPVFISKVISPTLLSLTGFGKNFYEVAVQNKKSDTFGPVTGGRKRVAHR